MLQYLIEEGTTRCLSPYPNTLNTRSINHQIRNAPSTSRHAKKKVKMSSAAQHGNIATANEKD
jgi:hypothetical protein